jgi:hypothetical protein
VKKNIAFLLVGVLVCGGAAAVLFWPTPRRQAVARVNELDGTVWEDRDSDGRQLTIVSFAHRPITDADLAVLRGIRPLHRLILDGSRVTDAGLAQLEGIEGLEDIRLCGTVVTDSGLVHLKRIPALTAVHLRNTQVSDAGLAQLNGLPHLVYVNAIQTRVTAAGETELRKTTPSLKVVHRVEPID